VDIPPNVQTTPFAAVLLAAMHDRRLSWKAKGILAWLVFHPHLRPVTARALARCANNGLHAVRSGLYELHHAGYVTFDEATVDVQTMPVEGGIYRGLASGRFEVLLVGMLDRAPCIVLRRGHELELVRRRALVDHAPDAELVDRVHAAHCHVGCYRGVWLEVCREDGELRLYARAPGPVRGERITLADLHAQPAHRN